MNRFVLSILIATCLAMPHEIPSQSFVSTSPLWGPSVEGLRIGISAPSATIQWPARFTVSLQNTSDADFVVNLGSMLANGKVMWPEAVRLVLTDAANNTRELHFFDRRYPGIGGRLDDFTVALRAGAIYALPVSLDNYWSPVEIKLVPGSYRIFARFDGGSASYVNLDTKGIALMNFWKGTATSDSLKFELSQ